MPKRLFHPSLLGLFTKAKPELPNEPWLEILGHLDYRPLKRMQRVNQQFRSLTQRRLFDAALFRARDCTAAPASENLAAGTYTIHPLLRGKLSLFRAGEGKRSIWLSGKDKEVFRTWDAKYFPVNKAFSYPPVTDVEVAINGRLSRPKGARCWSSGGIPITIHRIFVIFGFVSEMVHPLAGTRSHKRRSWME